MTIIIIIISIKLFYYVFNLIFCIFMGLYGTELYLCIISNPFMHCFEHKLENVQLKLS